MPPVCLPEAFFAQAKTPMLMNILNLVKKPIAQRVTTGVLMVLGIIMILFSIHKNVYLVINGELQEHTTFALTVNRVLEELDISLHENDRLSLNPNKLLWGGETIFITLSQRIQIYGDDQAVSLLTAERNPANILLEANLLLFPHDQLLIDGRPSQKAPPLAPAASHTIQVLRGTPINLHTKNGILHFITDEYTLVDALWKENIVLYEGDHISPPLNTSLDGTPLTVELIRSKPLQVFSPKASLSIRTTAESVGEALAQTGLSLQGLDYSHPSEEEPLPENGQIEVIRVKEEILLNQEQIQFTSEYEPVNDLALDQLHIVSGGEFGIMAQRLRIIYENGLEVSREVEKEWTIKEPQPRVIGYGTNINIQTASTSHGQISYWRKITAYATSYDSTCPGCDTITAMGTVLKKGTIAVTLDWYRYMKGAKVYIPGYGFGRIEDVGGGVPWSANWIDLGYKKENYVPWSQNVTVYFLAPAPPPENIMYVLY